MPLNQNVRDCQHIKVTGVQCGSPAMRGEQFCYFHQRMLRGVKTPPNARLHPIAMLENEEAIQASLMEVVNALVRNHIDLRRADLILKALNIAVRNSRRARFGVDNNQMVREVPEYAPAPAPVKAAARTEKELPQIAAELAATDLKTKDALARLQASALATVGASAKPAATAAPKQHTAEVARFTLPDPTQRKPPARAATPAPSTKRAVNQRE